MPGGPPVSNALSETPRPRAADRGLEDPTMRLCTLLLCATASAFAATAAMAEPDITGMWATYQPEGRVRQPPAKFTPEAAKRNADDQKINAAAHRLVGEAHTKCWPTGMPGL